MKMKSKYSYLDDKNLKKLVKSKCNIVISQESNNFPLSSFLFCFHEIIFSSKYAIIGRSFLYIIGKKFSDANEYRNDIEPLMTSHIGVYLCPKNEKIFAI